MFPVISDLVNYLFGTDFSWAIPTFGFFVTLAFILSYLTFKKEFERKERLQQFKAFEEEVRWGIKEKTFLFLGYGLLGFFIGYKGIGALLEKETFFYNPLRFIFSTQGNWKMGVLLALACCVIVGVVYRKMIFSKTMTETRWMRPKELLPIMLLWAGVTGFIGAKIFNVFEDGLLYKTHGFADILDFSGLTFWGGLIFGGFSYFYIGIRKGLGWRDLADVGSLGMLVAYSVGRMGCHLSGDGDWGIVNTFSKPFTWWPDGLWSFNYPHNVANQGVRIPGCEGKYCYVLPEGVFPTSLYESIFMLIVFILLWWKADKIKTPGLLFVIYLFVVGLERFFIEFIRVNYKFDVGGWLLSEAQLIGFFITLLAFIMLGIIKLKNRKSRLTSSLML